MTDQKYIPSYAKSIKDEDVTQFRILLQGAAGTGKTWAATTFPNPLFLNFDRGLGAHAGKDILEIPFYDDKFINEVLKVPNDKDKNIIKPDRRPNRRDALRKFLQNEGSKFQSNQTLILDSWTAVQNSFDIQTRYEPSFNFKGQEDGFAFWQQKIEYSAEVCGEILKSLPCNVIVICHEFQEVDENNKATGKFEPLMQGGFKKQLASHFSDVYRAIYHEGKYVWQVGKTDKFEAKNTCRNLPAGQVIIEANYEAWRKVKYATA